MNTPVLQFKDWTLVTRKRSARSRSQSNPSNNPLYNSSYSKEYKEGCKEKITIKCNGQIQIY